MFGSRATTHIAPSPPKPPAGGPIRPPTRNQIPYQFCNRPKVQRAGDRGRRVALTRAGAFVRRKAKDLIRKRKFSARPGQPPHSHEGSLRRLIFFSYDPARKTVVGLRRRWRKRRVRIRARPFMGPALRKEAPKFPKLWADSVR